jgi:hypothetical protein
MVLEVGNFVDARELPEDIMRNLPEVPSSSSDI